MNLLKPGMDFSGFLLILWIFLSLCYALTFSLLVFYNIFVFLGLVTYKNKKHDAKR